MSVYHQKAPTKYPHANPIFSKNLKRNVKEYEIEGEHSLCHFLLTIFSVVSSEMAKEDRNVFDQVPIPLCFQNLSRDFVPDLYKIK